MIQQRVEVLSVNEPWCVAKLADGSIVQMRAIFIEVFQCLNDDGTPMFTPDGKTLLYGVNNSVVLSVINSPNMVTNVPQGSRKN